MDKQLSENKQLSEASDLLASAQSFESLGSLGFCFVLFLDWDGIADCGGVGGV